MIIKDLIKKSHLNFFLYNIFSYLILREEIIEEFSHTQCYDIK